MALCYYCCVDVFSDQPHAEGCPAQLPAEKDALREWNLGFRDSREEPETDSEGPQEKRSCYYQLGLKVGRATQVLADSETPIVEEIREDRLSFHERYQGVRRGHFDLYKLFRADLEKKPDNDNDDED